MVNISPRYLQAHYQSHTSPRFNQSFVKELAKPTPSEKLFKKFADTFKKIKNSQHEPTEKTEIK
jgi:hypothetical protein